MRAHGRDGQAAAGLAAKGGERQGRSASWRAPAAAWQLLPRCPRTGKRSFPARRLAKQALRANADVLGVEMSVFKCGECGYFHFGHRR